MFARLSLDLVAGRLNAERQPVDGQSQLAKAIVVDSMEVGRARASVSGFAKIIDRLFEAFPGCAPGVAFSQSSLAAGMS